MLHLQAGTGKKMGLSGVASSCSPSRLVRGWATCGESISSRHEASLLISCCIPCTAKAAAELQCIRGSNAQVEAGASEAGTGWFLHQISVNSPEGATWNFPCNSWIGRSDADGLECKLLCLSNAFHYSVF